MKRTIPEHFKLDGQPKKKYHTKEEALKVAEKEKNKKHFKPKIYKCKFCGSYHIGHSKRKKKK